MVSVGTPTAALLLSFCKTSSSYLFSAVSSSRPFLSQRRSFFVATTTTTTTALGLISLGFPQRSWADDRQSTSSTFCESSNTRAQFLTRREMTSSSSSTPLSTGYLNAVDAAALDVELMSTPGFSLEQLMELAGLSVAEAVYEVVPRTTGTKPKILLICGPGNNGGDGLVAARHLVFFGYDCRVIYPKRSSKQHFVNLIQQCEDVGISVEDEMPSLSEMKGYDAIVDAIFGFSFKGAPREPFATALNQMIAAQSKDEENKGVPVISVDVPSGWNVDEGDVAGTGFVPDVLISLTTPKDCARGFQGRHFVGGRFLPPKLAEKYNVQMPPYQGVSQVCDVTPNKRGESSTNKETDTKQNSSQGNENDDDANWEAQYAAYLAEKHDEEQNRKQVKPSSSSSVVSSVHPQNEKGSGAMETEDSWEQQYADYCIEKEARLAREDEERERERKAQQGS